MKCEKCRELLLAEQARELTVAGAAEMERHLAECADCRRDAEEDAAIWQALRSLPEEELPEGYHAELMQKLRATQNVVAFPKKKQPKWKQLSLVAAALLLVVAAGGMNGILELRQNSMTTVMEAAEQDTAPRFAAVPMEEAAADEAAPTENTPTFDTAALAENVQASDTAALAENEEMKAAETADAGGLPAEEAEIAVQDLAQDFALNETAYSGARGGVMIQAAERLSLEVAEAAAARAAISEQLAALQGYEEIAAAEDLIYAVVPLENADAFREKLAEIGSLTQIESVPSQEGDAFRTFAIQLHIE